MFRRVLLSPMVLPVRTASRLVVTDPSELVLSKLEGDLEGVAVIGFNRPKAGGINITRGLTLNQPFGDNMIETPD